MNVELKGGPKDGMIVDEEQLRTAVQGVGELEKKMLPLGMSAVIHKYDTRTGQYLGMRRITGTGGKK